MSLICLGQSSTEIGATMEGLYARRQGTGNERLSHVKVSPVARDGALRFDVPSFFSMPSPDSATMNALVDRVFKELEGSDVRTSVGVVVDSCTGLGSSLSCALLQELSDWVPELPVHMAMSYTTDGDCLHGLGAYNHLMTMQASLLHADAVMCRGKHDILSLGCESLEEATTVVATDIMMALHPSLEWIDYRGLQRGGIFTSLPHTMYSPTKLFDVRSSLWKVCRVKVPGGREHSQKYNPLRAMSTNLHSLHLYSDPENTRRKHEVASANVYQMFLPQDNYSFTTTASGDKYPRNKQDKAGGGIKMAEKDILANLKWAMPKTKWQHLQVPCDAAHSISTSDDTIGDALEVNSLCFSSHHAHELQLLNLARVKALLSRQAFVHRYEEAGLEAYDLQCCVENVTAALGG